MPLYMRIPKLRGFTSKRKPTYNVYTDQLNSLKSVKIDNVLLADSGLIPNEFVNVKIIFKGKITKKMNVKTQSASKSAVEAIKSTGGNFEKIELLKRPKKAKS